MSLITCCPACGTMFKVVADQLKISEGWVRCGHCSEVFDATASMVPASQVPAPEQDLPPPTTAPIGLDFLAQEPAAPHPVSAPAEPTAWADEVAAQARAVGAADSSLPPESELDQVFIFRRSDLGRSDDLPLASPPMAPSRPAPLSMPPEDSMLQTEAEAEQAAATENASFVQQARRRAFWRRPLVRAVLLVLLLVFTGGLALQVAVQERDRLAVLQPDLRPYLQQLCERLQCTISAPRQIESLAIDASALNKLRNDTYRLSFTLKNGAPYPVAAPAMELTLTDTQDQPVLRRVLEPRELGASAPTVAAGGEWSGTVALAVAGSGADSRIAGYRILAFYP